MGGPNPDDAAGPMIPAAALTLSEMAARRWKIRAGCSKCGLVVRVSLDALIRCHGAYAEWWGRHPPCPRVHDGGFPCEGRLTYKAQGGKRATWVPLVVRDPMELARVKASRAG
jgi:hypothetical protein